MAATAMAILWLWPERCAGTRTLLLQFIEYFWWWWYGRLVLKASGMGLAGGPDQPPAACGPSSPATAMARHRHPERDAGIPDAAEVAR